jgi:hypothetical protein
MGIPLYGRTYILADPEQHGLNAPIIDNGIAGPYTKEPGFLSYYEVLVFQPPIEIDLFIQLNNSWFKYTKGNSSLQCTHSTYWLPIQSVGGALHLTQWYW